MQFRKIGVIGAGTMGIGMCIDLLYHDMNIVLVDLAQEILARAKSEVERVVRFAPLLDKSLPSIDPAIVAERVTFTTSMADVSDCDFIVENVNEDWQAKESVYIQLSSACREDVCFAANTSCISITKIGSATNRPDKVIGIHFMNPVYLKKTVEVIKGYHTTAECIDITLGFLQLLQKEAIIVNDLPGFVTNRISHLFMNEAAYVVQDGVATPAQVDEIFKKCFSHKMGPLETADLIGLDTVVNSLDILYQSYQDSKFRCCPLLRKMVDAKLLGRKTGKGFFQY